MKTSLKILTSLVVLANGFNAMAQTNEKELFPPIDIKTWEKTPCVNGRLATLEETQNGTALLYYDETEGAKPYPMALPKLAYATQTRIYMEHPRNVQSREKTEELVVVIQIVETPNDTMVGFRPLTGGNGASVFRDFRFLTDDEANE